VRARDEKREKERDREGREKSVKNAVLIIRECTNNTKTGKKKSFRPLNLLSRPPPVPVYLSVCPTRPCASAWCSRCNPQERAEGTDGRVDRFDGRDCLEDGEPTFCRLRTDPANGHFAHPSCFRRDRAQLFLGLHSSVGRRADTWSSCVTDHHAAQGPATLHNPRPSTSISTFSVFRVAACSYRNEEGPLFLRHPVHFAFSTSNPYPSSILLLSSLLYLSIFPCPSPHSPFRPANTST